MIFNKIKMTEIEMEKISSLVETEMGIRMSSSKKTMLESRLLKRLDILGINNFTDYYNYLTSEIGYKNEILLFINAVSTNKTDFFREEKHFNYLSSIMLPNFVQDKRNFKKIEIWSSACATGEEPYTIAMVIEEFLSKYKKKPFDYTVFASDISINALQKAYKAIYNEVNIKPIPKLYKYKYLMKNIYNKKLYRIIPEIRKKIYFKRINLLNDEFDQKRKMDIIFCRNVLIYFNREKQLMIIQKLINSLKKDGYLLIGHSESIIGHKFNLENVAPTIYRKTK